MPSSPPLVQNSLVFGATSNSAVKNNSSMNKNNLDPRTVASFGDEWSRFDQSGMSEDEAEKVFKEYFAVFP
jgi:hypothetical protein